MLYHVFPPATTTERSQYQRLEKTMSDHPSHLVRWNPAVIQDFPYAFARGSYHVKEGQEIDTRAWSLFLEGVNEVQGQGKMGAPDVASVGHALLKAWGENTIAKDKRKLFMTLYRMYEAQGHSLPSDLGSIQNLLAYKEFVGDRLRDLIQDAVTAFKKKQPEAYTSFLEGRLNGILPGQDAQRDLLVRTKVFEQMTGSENGMMRRELFGDPQKPEKDPAKLEYKISPESPQISFRFHVTKRKAHAVVGLCEGVCTSSDKKLWDNRDFLQVIFFGEDNVAQGGMHLLVVEDHGKKYLSLPGINPSIWLLGQTDADQFLESVVDFAWQLADSWGLAGVWIPTKAEIHSNRPPLQEAIARRFVSTEPTKTAKHILSHQPSYEFDLVYSVPRPAQAYTGPKKGPSRNLGIIAGLICTSLLLKMFPAGNVLHESQANLFGGDPLPISFSWAFSVLLSWVITLYCLWPRRTPIPRIYKGQWHGRLGPTKSSA